MDSIKLKESERKRFEDAEFEERDGIDEFAAETRSAMSKNAKATNLIRKIMTGLEMLNTLGAVFVGTAQCRMRQGEQAEE